MRPQSKDADKPQSFLVQCKPFPLELHVLTNNWSFLFLLWVQETGRDGNRTASCRAEWKGWLLVRWRSQCLRVPMCRAACSPTSAFKSCLDLSFPRLWPPSCLNGYYSHLDQCHPIYEVTLLKDPKDLRPEKSLPEGPTCSSLKKHF